MSVLIFIVILRQVLACCQYGKEQSKFPECQFFLDTGITFHYKLQVNF